MPNDSFNGWTLTEAAERVPSLVDCLRAGRLLAWGKRETVKAIAAPLSPADWHDAVPTVASPKKLYVILAGVKIYDLRIFPVIEAPNAVQHIGAIPLSDLFGQYVLGDPEVAHLSELARKSSPNERPERLMPGHLHFRSLEVGHLFEADEFDDLADKYFRDRPITNEEKNARSAFRERFRTMINLLRSGNMIAFGDPVRPNDPFEILRTIWGSDGYHFEERSGDLYEWNNDEYDGYRWDDGRHNYDLRWRAVLVKPAAIEAKTGDVVAQALHRAPSRRTKHDMIVSFLEDEMKRSPNKRPKSKILYRIDADKIAGGVGRPTFSDAWETAKQRVPEAAPAWSAAGAPKK